MPHKLIFLDTETTSINTDTCGLIQIAGCIDIDGQTVEEFEIQSNIYANDSVDEEALVKNGITLEQIYQYQHPGKAFVQLCKILGKYVDAYNKKDKFIAIGYVADFDNRVLRSWFRKNSNDYFGSWFWHPWIDVMNLAAYVYQDRRQEFENFKQETVAKFMGIECDSSKCHDAMYDMRLTKEIYYALMGGEQEKPPRVVYLPIEDDVPF